MMEMIIEFFADFILLWQRGGLLMWPLLLIAIFLYWNAFDLFSRLSQYDFSKIRNSLPSDIVTPGSDKKTMRSRISLIKAEYIPYIDRRLIFITVLAGVSPLVGLLGTVMGILDTFALMNRGNTQKSDLMAGGISEALITTQMGLIIAVPGLLMIMMLKIRRDRLSIFFEKLESEYSQKFMKTKGGV